MRAAKCLIPLIVTLVSPGLFAQVAVPVITAPVAPTPQGAAVSTVSAATPIVTTPAIVTPILTTPIVSVPGNLRLTNLSTRARVTADHPLVIGFVLRGTTSRTVLVRAAGPALIPFGITDAVGAPRLRLHDVTGKLIAENAGWNKDPLAAAAITSTGAFAFADGSTDAAVVATLTPGSYTAQVTVEGVGGVALVEIYDGDRTDDGSRLANASALSHVAPAGGEVVCGFVLAGTGTRNFLIRGIGPTLAAFGVTGALSDPTLGVYDATGRQVAGNDDWTGNIKTRVVAVALAGGSSDETTPAANAALVRAASLATGAFPLSETSSDAALVTTLQSGAYTVQVSGFRATQIVTTPGPTPDTTSGTASVAAAVAAATVQTISLHTIPADPGVALVELYEVP